MPISQVLVSLRSSFPCDTTYKTITVFPDMECTSSFQALQTCVHNHVSIKQVVKYLDHAEIQLTSYGIGLRALGPLVEVLKVGLSCSIPRILYCELLQSSLQGATHGAYLSQHCYGETNYKVSRGDRIGSESGGSYVHPMIFNLIVVFSR